MSRSRIPQESPEFFSGGVGAFVTPRATWSSFAANGCSETDLHGAQNPDSVDRAVRCAEPDERIDLRGRESPE